MLYLVSTFEIPIAIFSFVSSITFALTQLIYHVYFRYLTNVSYLSVGENDLTQLPDEIGNETERYKI